MTVEHADRVSSRDEESCRATFGVIRSPFAVLSLSGCSKKAEPVGDASPSVAVANNMGMATASALAIPGQTFANTAAASDTFGGL